MVIFKGWFFERDGVLHFRFYLVSIFRSGTNYISRWKHFLQILYWLLCFWISILFLRQSFYVLAGWILVTACDNICAVSCHLTKLWGEAVAPILSISKYVISIKVINCSLSSFKKARLFGNVFSSLFNCLLWEQWLASLDSLNGRWVKRVTDSCDRA